MDQFEFVREDTYIWEEFKKGEEYALTYIYDHHIDFLFLYGKKITKDENLILDVIQDLFFELIRKKKNLGQTDNIRLYLLKSFRRKLIRQIQVNQKHDQIDRETELYPHVVFSAEEDIIFQEENTHFQELVKLGLKELNQKQREVL